MANNGKEIIKQLNGNNAVAGSGRATSARNLYGADTLKELSEKFDNFNKTVDKSLVDLRKVTKTVEHTDCGEVIDEALAKANSFLGEIGQEIQDKLDSLKQLAGLSVDFSFADTICFTINGFLKEMNVILELMVKAPLILLKKIERLMDMVEKALFDLSSALENCLLQLVVDAKVAITRFIRSGIINFDELTDVMNSCDCVFQMTKWIFAWSDCGNAETPEELIQCLKNEFGLSPENIINAINTFINENIIKNIRGFFDKIEQILNTLKELLLQPLREIVKLYCKLLNFGIPAPYLNIPFVSDPFLCLFEYSEKKVTVFGVDIVVRTQSVIEILNTFKIWVSCLDALCGSFSDDIKLQLQRYNRDLRLDFQYWMNDAVADIYFACIHNDKKVENGRDLLRNKNESDTVRDTTVRELYIDSKIKQLDNTITSTKTLPDAPIPELPSREPEVSAFDEKMYNQNPPENFETINISDGTELFKGNVEQALIKVISNISKEIGEDYYYRKLQELVTWADKFKKSQDYITESNKAVEAYNNAANDKSGDNGMVFGNNLSKRTKDDESYVSPVVPVVPSYEVSDDYVEIKLVDKPEQKVNESPEDLMVRWFNECIS